MINDFDTISNNLMSYIKQRKANQIKAFFKLFFKRREEYNISYQQLMDLIGNLLYADDIFFEKKLFKPIRKKLKRYIDDSQLISLDQYLLERYCILEGEKILAGFTGQLYFKSNNVYVKGHIFLTNYRFIGVDEMIFGTEHSRSPIGDIKFLLNMKKLKKGVGIIDFFKQKPLYGYDLSIFGAEKIRSSSKGKRFSYSINLNYQDGKKIKNFKLNPEVKILKNLHESKQDYRIRLPNLSKLILGTLNSAQSIPRMPQVDTQSVNVRYCTNCGAELRGDFCSKCGFRKK